MSVGALFHVAHTAEDIVVLDDLYERLFTPWHGMLDQHVSSVERRVGSLLVVGDSVVETMCPSPGADGASGPVGRFLGRFGAHWHSIAWYTDDVGAVWDRLTGNGVRVVGPGGAAGGRPVDGAVYTHPKDTVTQLEFYQPPPRRPGQAGVPPFGDPRFDPDWAERWAGRPNPLGVRGPVSVTVLTPDLDATTSLCTEVLGGVLVHDEVRPLVGTRSRHVALGPQTVLELATPVPSPSTPAADLARHDLVTHGGSCHAVTFTVDSLDRAAAHLAAQGVGVLGDDGETLVADPAHTCGALLRCTVRPAEYPLGP